MLEVVTLLIGTKFHCSSYLLKVFGYSFFGNFFYPSVIWLNLAVFIISKTQKYHRTKSCKCFWWQIIVVLARSGQFLTILVAWSQALPWGVFMLFRWFWSLVGLTFWQAGCNNLQYSSYHWRLNLFPSNHLCYFKEDGKHTWWPY